MSKELVLHMTISLDGFIAGPNKEFDWAFAAMSDEGKQMVAERMSEASLIAMGHGAYQEMAAFWPTAPSPIAPVMNRIPKVVFSRSGEITSSKTTAALESMERTPEIEGWLHPTVLGKDLVADIQGLKAEDGKPIIAIAGVEFAQSLVAANLVDEFRLSVHPVALGQGLPLFGKLTAPLRLKLEDIRHLASGVVGKTYRPC